MKRILGVGAVVILLGTGLYIADLPLFKPAPPGADQVVLLHGLGRSESAMLVLENSLAGAGFEVHNIGYPSNDESPDQLVARVTADINACCANNDRTVHFVGHSLGGLLIRAYLAEGLPDNLGRVVLLGTPNKGSELADLEEGLPGTMVEMAGPTAQMLGTGPDGFAASLPAPDFEVGVIAGTRDALLTNEWLPLPNDSMVSLDSARLDGMTDFREFKVTHWGLRNDPGVAAATIHFLDNGLFPPPEADEIMESNTLPGLIGFTLESQNTGRTYPIGIGLPEDYDPEQTYPVIYATDGSGKIHTLIETTRTLSRYSGLTSVIVVGIGNASRDSRTTDFTPSPWQDLPALSGLTAETVETGGGPAFYRFIRDELIPRVEDDYSADQNSRIYFGHSYGGLFGLHALQQADTPFSAFLISSPSVWWNDREPLRVDMPARDKPIIVYLTVGEFEQIPPNLDPEILALFPQEAIDESNGTRMVEGLVETYDYLVAQPDLEVYAFIEESAPHVGADIPGFFRGIRLLLPGRDQGELKRRSSGRPALPWE